MPLFSVPTLMVCRRNVISPTVNFFDYYRRGQPILGLRTTKISNESFDYYRRLQPTKTLIVKT